ncbi:acyl-CoA N-acyltransferase [Aaosphaeria arxii CBS 175.79]|uniref:Acyl-CoA N-acyltransferase n=1 Tax=Aaosphaeria arxii CBS 175.79 TaxID=1450172 RepID=A0A6A5XCM8_9PLEO|nr:acyl-CoA N-acyltransferase [Aaosphaeria arxii CBS 175.79]KAF2010728.1 acyl-CoA N-acyltransferase [Aaosphaeria arxii CBS 175.79]
MKQSVDTGANPLGFLVPDEPAEPPSYDITLTGRYVTIVPISPDHAEDLYEQIGDEKHIPLFDYLFDEHPNSVEELRASLTQKSKTSNPWAYAILSNDAAAGSTKAVGMASLMRMDQPNRVIEVGSILYTPALQRTPAATEAMYLLARYVFETLHFRRYEWKLNSLNAPSHRAAKRLGFVYEGTFRQHMIARGQNRDTAWYSIIDSEWPVMKSAFEQWLSVENFDAEGRQKKRLEDFRG